MPIKYVFGRPTISVKALNDWWDGLPEGERKKISMKLIED
jgi:hypothetical protein